MDVREAIRAVAVYGSVYEPTPTGQRTFLRRRAIIWNYGDFNDTVSLEERNHGGLDMLRRCEKFKHWIENNGLIDLGYSGPEFTWTRRNSIETRKYARLDRALCNPTWRTRFQEGAVQHLLQNYSNHSPLLISTHGFMPVPERAKPFCFQLAWTSHEDFDQEVQKLWKEDAPVMPALHSLSVGLNKWNKETFSNLFRHVSEALVECGVRDPWNENGGWKWDELAEYLLPPILQCLASFELMEEGVGDNFF
ncbi:hypothetical protein Cgig2_002807 [Carnegiea gigantea]|uniref:Uncharacterized protein n=1 Tax=Carnegiea gigantea TaxID=171969 RepID=A0A9Q1KN23_9CARY|nr:hypothetical protein Cgig2_002807 [Carnegiea gigantea]